MAITRENQTFGYARVSTRKQSINRQITNISKAFPTVKRIYSEAYTGTKIDERKEFEKLLKHVIPGDTIVFDSVSRMSRNADDGIKLYLELYHKGINLIFLNEPQINTDTYQSALETSIQMTGDDVDVILQAINTYLIRLATKQIRLAFEQAEKEVKDLQTRTQDAVKEARKQGKQIGQKQGATLHVKKKEPAKAVILKHSKDFYGTLGDAETMKLAGVSRNTYYKYKAELAAEVNQ